MKKLTIRALAVCFALSAALFVGGRVIFVPFFGLYAKAHFYVAGISDETTARLYVWMQFNHPNFIPYTVEDLLKTVALFVIVPFGFAGWFRIMDRIRDLASPRTNVGVVACWILLALSYYVQAIALIEIAVHGGPIDVSTMDIRSPGEVAAAIFCMTVVLVLIEHAIYWGEDILHRSRTVQSSTTRQDS